MLVGRLKNSNNARNEKARTSSALPWHRSHWILPPTCVHDIWSSPERRGADTDRKMLDEEGGYLDEVILKLYLAVAIFIVL
jgi:hypothetical protein